jgi:hypothetical protein
MLTLESVTKRFRGGNYGVRDVSLDFAGFFSTPLARVSLTYVAIAIVLTTLHRPFM